MDNNNTNNNHTTGWKILPDTSYSYRLSNPLGKGTYGTVYLGIDKHTEDHVAVKSVIKEFIQKLNKVVQLERELEFFTRKDIKHDNIVNCLSVYEDDTSYYLITEFCEGGDLFKYLMKKKEISESEVIDIMVDILNGYSYLKSLGFIHRDLKTENILIKNGRYKICDFGSIRSTSQGLLISAAPGTQAYMSPEMLQGTEIYDYKTDIWSLGVIFYELLYAKLPFQSRAPVRLYAEIEEYENNPSSIFPSDKPVSQQTKDLIIRMMCVDHNKRISMEEIVNSVLFGVETENQSPRIKRRSNMNTNNNNNSPTFPDTLPRSKTMFTIENNDNTNNNNKFRLSLETGSNSVIIRPATSSSNIQLHTITNTKIRLYPTQQHPVQIIDINSPSHQERASTATTSRSKIILTDLHDDKKLKITDDKKQKITIIKADEKTEVDLTKLSNNIEIRSEGLNTFRERMFFEMHSIDHIKKLIDASRQFASLNKLDLIKYYQLTFPLAKIACMKYGSIIRPIYKECSNTIGMPDDTWDLIKTNKEFLNIIKTIYYNVCDQEQIYPNFLSTLKENLDKSPLKRPLSTMDEKFMELLNYDLKEKDKEKVLNFYSELLNEIYDQYTNPSNNHHTNNQTHLDSLRNFVNILKSGKIVDILVLTRSSK